MCIIQSSNISFFLINHCCSAPVHIEGKASDGTMADIESFIVDTIAVALSKGSELIVLVFDVCELSKKKKNCFRTIVQRRKK